MSFRSNLHTHTTYCDGVSTAREMTEAAQKAGFVSLGFSGHAYSPYDPCGMSPENTLAYRQDVLALREEYAGRLEIFLGLENDSAASQDVSGYDYSIGSVHHLLLGGEWYGVDESPEEAQRLLARGCGGDALKMAQVYYDTVAGFARTSGAQIVGHFDLIEKFNAGGRLFDSESPAYQKIALEALDAILPLGTVFEVNTGAIARGFRDIPYPMPFLLRRLLEKKAPILVSSDAHDAAKLTMAFPEVARMLYDIGFRETMELRRGQGFVPVPLSRD